CRWTQTPGPAVLKMRGICCWGVGVGSGGGGGAGGRLGAGVGALAWDSGAGVSVGALAAVTRGVTAGVGARVATGVLVPTFARTGGSARPAFKMASAATAPISPSSIKLLSTCQAVSRRRPPFDQKGRPHQSHSGPPAGFFPPPPGQTWTL